MKNILAVFGCMLFALAVAAYAFFGNPSRGNPTFIGIVFTVAAGYLGYLAIKAIRNRRRGALRG
ncbi:hypothetical protein Val02_71290 [Virgisporangium aliadipatigenens]|uniref:Uncharacterized protein n=1 Tax=Virgisporangium aliadipatigenens TaxID=741659 RepID=A0A8J3YV18_9ACTN|nr:hypothetical protein Val02_71290 [Virgisporangium aliadipatigenens]